MRMRLLDRRRNRLPQWTTAVHPARRRLTSSRRPSRTIGAVTFTQTLSMPRARTAPRERSLPRDQPDAGDDQDGTENLLHRQLLAEERDGGEGDQDVAERGHRVGGEERLPSQDADPEERRR